MEQRAMKVALGPDWGERQRRNELNKINSIVNTPGVKDGKRKHLWLFKNP